MLPLYVALLCIVLICKCYCVLCNVTVKLILSMSLRSAVDQCTQSIRMCRLEVMCQWNCFTFCTAFLFHYYRVTYYYILLQAVFILQVSLCAVCLVLFHQ